MRSFREVGINRVGFAGLMALLASGQALAANNVAFTLEMGGDNHASAYKSGTKVLFTPGTTSDGVILAAGDVTWGVRIAVTGTHAGVANPGTQYPTNGVANFVFDLELHSGTVNGPLIQTAVWKSSINDGLNGDILAKAAFAMSFNIGNSGPGRVVDPAYGLPPGSLMGGPLCGGVDNTRFNKLKSALYPTYYTGAGADQYKLVGMGAGYNAWKACCAAAQTTPGIGVDTLAPLTGGVGLGSTRTICEGQIGNLPLGTYVLKLTPAAGINILRGDIDLKVDQNSFALATDTPATGDTITFTIGNPLAIKASNPAPAVSESVTANPVALSWTAGQYATSHTVYLGTTNNPPQVSLDQPGVTYAAGSLTNGTYYWRVDSKNVDGIVTTGDLWSFTVDVIDPLVITQWRSIRNHAAAGDLAVVLDPSGTTGPGVSSEPRVGGIQKIQVDFNQYTEMQDVPVAMGSDAVVYIPNSVMIDDDTLEMTFPNPIPNGVCLTINLAGKPISAGGELSGDTECVIRNLYGDANPTNGGTISLSDALVVLARVGTAPSLSAWADLDRNGTIDVADALAAKGQIGGTACP